MQGMVLLKIDWEESWELYLKLKKLKIMIMDKVLIFFQAFNMAWLTCYSFANIKEYGLVLFYVRYLKNWLHSNDSSIHANK